MVKVLFDRYHDFRDYHSSSLYHAAYPSSWVEWACRHEQEFVVGEILSHLGNHQQRSNFGVPRPLDWL
jgi:hypothetical protein